MNVSIHALSVEYVDGRKDLELQQIKQRTELKLCEHEEKKADWEARIMAQKQDAANARAKSVMKETMEAEAMRLEMENKEFKIEMERSHDILARQTKICDLAATFAKKLKEAGVNDTTVSAMVLKWFERVGSVGVRFAEPSIKTVTMGKVMEYRLPEVEKQDERGVSSNAFTSMSTSRT